VRALRLATRGSPLALAQARSVAAVLASRGVVTELVEVVTTGDRRRDVAIAEMSGQGVFAVEVQRRVLDGEADVAVHSAKDLPSSTPEGLLIASVPERLDPADVLVGRSLAGLGPGATVATGSPRRAALLLERRPDLTIVGIRGNMSTRLARAGRDGVDAVVAAAAALERLGELGRVAERLDPSWCTPQVGQGAIALEVRADDEEAVALTAAIDDETAHVALRAERAFLRELGAGCAVPAAALATVTGTITVAGVMAAPDGSTVLRDQVSGADPETLGTTLARTLRDDRGGSRLAGFA
jgi:hydroxymethylbilane synthase